MSWEGDFVIGRPETSPTRRGHIPSDVPSYTEGRTTSGPESCGRLAGLEDPRRDTDLPRRRRGSPERDPWGDSSEDPKVSDPTGRGHGSGGGVTGDRTTRCRSPRDSHPWCETRRRVTVTESRVPGTWGPDHVLDCSGVRRPPAVDRPRSPRVGVLLKTEGAKGQKQTGVGVQSLRVPVDRLERNVDGSGLPP